MTTFRPSRIEDLSARILQSDTLIVHGQAPGADAGSVALDLSEWSQTIDYPAADMTITVQSGCTFKQLEDTLRENGQCLPIDVANLDIQLGDAVSRDLFGSRRFGYGSFRDYVIGLSAIDGTGRAFKSGGRVVKNVAGYDLCKLLTGSHGTLAVITELTFKVVPVSEARAGVRFEFESWDALDGTLERLATSETRPVAMDVIESESEIGSLIVVYEGSDKEVAWQTATVRTEVERAINCAELSDEDIGHYLTSAASVFQQTVESGTFRAGMLPSRVVNVLKAAKSSRFVAHAGLGSVAGIADQSLEDAVKTSAGWIQRSSATKPFDGSSMTKTMQKVKQAFDPRGVFNPHIVV